jgi:amino acid adenylation domain-containing protein
MQTVTGDLRPVPEQIAEFGDNHPHSIALSFGNQQLTYAELDRKADQFAGQLMKLGVAPGGTVAICMERSFDWIVAALGIMRAGAAYVPLDSAWPDARLRYAVNDSGASILVARAALLDRLQVKARGLDPGRDAAAIAVAPKAEHKPLASESLAYVIYTSGWTGVPKGVEITHANLSHLIEWHREAFSVTRQDRASHLAGLGFDAAVWEIWPHLAAGATLCLADNAARSSPELMQQWMIRERVTIAFVPTVHAAPMMAMLWPSATALRLLLTGGDVLHQCPAAQLPLNVVNNYGPTECTVVATSSVLKPGSRGAPPIGRPIAGATVYLLDERGEPVPDGSIGEIYIGGGGVGHGYRNLPESTERSFLADPFAEAPGSRMYRTGDRGLRRPDGEIEFRGRLDRQTKVRGQRVELDEIASILSQHPGLDYATAITNASEGRENELVAYVLPRENALLPTVYELQKHLLRRLPEYMVPAIFVRLHTLPLSPSGKLDLAMLPPPTDANLLEKTAAKAPPTRIEEELLAMARQLLKNDAFRAQDNFFLAGGHSLLGMQLLMRLQDTFGVDLTLRQLFEAPTVERLTVLVETMLRRQRLAVIWADLLGRKSVQLDDNFFDLGGHEDLMAALQQRIAAEFGQHIPMAELLENPTVRQQANLTQSIEGTRSITGTNPGLHSGVVALRPHETRNRIFWVHYLSVNLATVTADDQSFLFVVLTAEDFASLGEIPTLQSIAACLLRKILATQAKGPYTIGGFCAGGVLAYEIGAQMRAAGHEVSLLVLLDAPNLAYLGSHDSLADKLTYPGYVLKRAARLGLRTGVAHLREQLHKRLENKPKSDKSEMTVAQEMVKAAVSAYQPKKYEGKVLLLMASERPAHMDLLPGWQSVVPHDLHPQYLNGHRNDLLKPPNVRHVVDAIVSHLTSATDSESPACCASAPASTTLAPREKSTAVQARMKDGCNGNAESTSTPVHSMRDEEAEKHLTE